MEQKLDGYFFQDQQGHRGELWFKVGGSSEKRMEFFCQPFCGCKSPLGQQLSEETQVNHKSNLMRTQKPMGVRDILGHGMTNRRFDLTKAPFAVL